MWLYITSNYLYNGEEIANQLQRDLQPHTEKNKNYFKMNLLKQLRKKTLKLMEPNHYF